MALKAAFWVHGTIVEAEDPGPWLNTRRVAWGMYFKTVGNGHWFHIPLTTPVILDDQRPKLAKIFVFYETFNNAKITQVEIWDGREKVKGFYGLDLQGDHSRNVEAGKNNWVIGPPLVIGYSLGISVFVEFKKNGDAIPEVLFTSFGADFVPG